MRMKRIDGMTWLEAWEEFDYGQFTGWELQRVRNKEEELFVGKLVVYAYEWGMALMMLRGISRQVEDYKGKNKQQIVRNLLFVGHVLLPEEEQEEIQRLWDEGLKNLHPDTVDWRLASELVPTLEIFSTEAMIRPRAKPTSHIESADSFFALQLFDSAKIAYFNAIESNQHTNYAITRYIECATTLGTLQDDFDEFGRRLDFEDLTPPQYAKFIHRLSKTLIPPRPPPPSGP